MCRVFVTSVPLLEIVFRTVVVYVAVFALLRIAGKRELGQMNVTDLVVILVIANAVQNSLNGGDTSLVGGIVAAATLVALNVLVDRYGKQVPFLQRFVRSEPMLLIQDGVFIDKNLEQENVTKDAIQIAPREHRLKELSEVSEAILEPDGSISIIPNEGGRIHRVRRIRQLRQRP